MYLRIKKLQRENIMPYDSFWGTYSWDIYGTTYAQINRNKTVTNLNNGTFKTQQSC